jgi:predicted dehydrogenase
MAIVGVGWAGRRQVEATQELAGPIEVVTLVDRDADHLATTAAELGVTRIGTDLDAALAADDVDAVSICTPHDLHAPMAHRAIAAGKHVLVEKPMATSVADATLMVETAEDAGVTLYVAEHHPYEARFGELRRIVRSGEHIGELTFAACIAGYRAPSPAYAGRRAWLTDPAAGGTGTWTLQGIHTVAALRYVLGEVVSVYVLDHRARSFERPDIEATMSGVVELESGVVVWLVQTTETHLKPQLTGFRLYGDAGVVIGRDDAYEVYEGDVREGQQPRLLPYPEQGLSPYALELKAFADTVAGRSAGPTTGRSERRSLAIIEAGNESARTRSPVDLRERFPGIWDDSEGPQHADA